MRGHLVAVVAALLAQACAGTPAAPEAPEPEAVPLPPAIVKAPPAPAAAGTGLLDSAKLPPLAEGREIREPLRGVHKVDRTAPVDDLWHRVRQGFAMPDLDNDVVRKQVAYYAARPDYLQRIFDRSRIYLYHIVEELEKRNLPTELALLPMVESAFNPMAYSRAHASGLWQFIPGTGGASSCSRTGGTTAGATSSPPPRRRSTTSPSSTRCTATGISRSPRTTGARARWRGRSPRTARRAGRPTTGA